MPPTTPSPRRKRAAAEAARKRLNETNQDDEDEDMPNASPSHRGNHHSSDDGSEYNGADDTSSDEDVNMPDDGAKSNSSDEDTKLSIQPSQPPMSVAAPRNDPDDDLAHRDHHKAGEGSASSHTVPSQSDGTKKQKAPSPHEDERSEDEYNSFDDSDEEPLIDTEGLSREELFNLHRHRVWRSRRKARLGLPRYPTKAELARGVQPPTLPDGMKFCAECRYARPLSEFERKTARGKVSYVKHCLECAQDKKEYGAHKLGLLQDAAAKDPTKKLCLGPCKQLKPLEAFERIGNGKTTQKSCSECAVRNHRYRENSRTMAQDKFAKHKETADATSPDLKLCNRCSNAQPLVEFVRTSRGKNDGEPYEHESCNTCARVNALADQKRTDERMQKVSMSNNALRYCTASKHYAPVSEFTRLGRNKTWDSEYKVWKICNSCTEKIRTLKGFHVNDEE